MDALIQQHPKHLCPSWPGMEQAINGTHKVPTHTANPFIQNKHVYPYKVYAALCCMKYVLDIISPGHSFTKKLVDLMSNCPLAQEKEMGFPAKWSEEKFWQI